MAHKVYENFVLSSLIEDQFDTHINMQTFFKVDDELAETAGMKRIINVYSATDNTTVVDMGEGNEDSIEVSYEPKEYVVKTAQNRFVYYDEQEMKDPNLVPVGMQRMGSGMFNFITADYISELNRATLQVEAEELNFDAFVDALAKLNVESTDNDPQDITAFAFINPNDMATIRKNLKDDLKFVEAFSRTGYVGTVAGVSLFVNKAITEGDVVVATRDAVTLFYKKGVEVEQSRVINTRQNEVVSREYYIVALTDATKAVKIVTSATTPSVVLDKRTATVEEAGTVDLTATTIPDDAVVTWTSDTEAVATVSDGTVTGVSAGKATITATITVDGEDYTDTCEVTVTAG